jgi:RNA polymerase sigma factor (sigma-70 family)
VDQSQINDRRLASLMQSAQDGDAAAFSLLLREITPLLRRTALRKSYWLHPHNVEDIVQEILLSVHTARATYDPERPFLPWLMTIARNRVTDAIRQNARRSAHEVAVEQLPEIRSDVESHGALTGYGDGEQLRKAIHQLPSAQRTAVELLKLREMTLKEAAAVTGMSIGALKVAVHRAIRTLGAVLDKEV